MEQHHDVKKDRQIYLDFDGSPEDIACLMLVLGMKHLHLIGITLTQADCSPKHSLETTLKILSLYEKKIEVVMGEYISPTQFPEEYKRASIQANNFPLLINQKMDHSLVSKLPAGEFMAKKINGAHGKVTVLVIGPMSHVARALEFDPKIADKIEEIVFMGGAIDVAGNVFQKDGTIESAEWNVYWDIDSAIKVFNTKIPITMFSLDATNHVPFTKACLKEIARHPDYNILNLVGQFYALCYNGDWTDVDNYYFWDTLCTSYLGCEGLAQYQNIEIEITPKGEKGEGKTARKKGNGRWVKVPMSVDKDKFFKFFIHTLKKHGKVHMVD